MDVDRIKLILLIYVVQMNAYFYQISVLLYILLCISAHYKQHEYITLISKVVYKTQYYLHYLLSSIVNGSQIQYS